MKKTYLKNGLLHLILKSFSLSLLLSCIPLTNLLAAPLECTQLEEDTLLHILNEEICEEFATSVLDISTGIDASGNPISPTEPSSNIDLNWQLINVPPTTSAIPPAVNIPDAWVIQPYNNSSTWNNVNGCTPISMNNSAGFNANNASQNQPWRFSNEFCVCEAVQVCIEGTMRADDEGSLWLHGSVGSGFTPVNIANTGPADFTVPYPFNIDTNFDTCLILLPGTYYLEFELGNQYSTASGFALTGTITEQTNDPQIYASNPECCDLGIISIQKMLDANCNGSIDNLDYPGVNWVFDVTNNDTGVTTTYTTDSFGEIILRGLEFGTYTITETLSGNSMPVTPGNEVQTVTISSGDDVKNLQFFNKSPENCDCVDEELIQLSDGGQEGCCWTLELTNNFGDYYDQVQVISNGFTFSSATSSWPLIDVSASEKTIDQVIPSGTHQALTFCTQDLNGFGNLVVNWLFEGEIVCESELLEFCEAEPEPCLIFENLEIECDSTQAGLYHLCFDVTNPAGNTDQFTHLNWSSSFPVSINPGVTNFSPVLQPGNTQGTFCLDIAFGGPFPTTIDLIPLAYGSNLNTGDSICCHLPPLEIELPRCCDPCETPWLNVNEYEQVDGLCCYGLDVENTCEDALSKIRVSSLTSGVDIVNLSTILDWSATSVTNGIAEWQYSLSPYAPVGTYIDVAQFCVNNASGSPAYSLLVEYIYIGINGEEVLCEEVLELECDPGCLEVEYEVYCVDGLYFIDFCVTNTNPLFTANGLDIIKTISSPGDLMISQSSFSFPNITQGGTYCNTIQVQGIFNSPVAGNTLSLEFALKFDDGDEIDCCEEKELIDIILPECCCLDEDYFYNQVLPATTLAYVNGVLTLDNPLLSECHELNLVWSDGVSQGPFSSADMPVIYNAPGVSGVCFTIEEIGSNDEVCFFGEGCLDAEEPEPACCEDEDYFYNTIVPATVMFLSGNTLTLQNNQANDCQLFSIDWGDGNSETFYGDQLPANHAYSSGFYLVCIQIYELNPLNDEACFLEEYCQEIDIDNGPFEMEAIKDTRVFEIPERIPSKSLVTNGKNLKISLYPNPTQDVVKVKSDNGSMLKSVEIADVSGNKLGTYILNQNEIQIDLAHLKAGVYFIQVIDEFGDTDIVKLVKN